MNESEPTEAAAEIVALRRDVDLLRRQMDQLYALCATAAKLLRSGPVEQRIG